jgi:hypothetical protein
MEKKVPNERKEYAKRIRELTAIIRQASRKGPKAPDNPSYRAQGIRERAHQGALRNAK